MKLVLAPDSPTCPAATAPGAFHGGRRDWDGSCAVAPPGPVPQLPTGLWATSPRATVLPECGCCSGDPGHSSQWEAARAGSAPPGRSTRFCGSPVPG